VAEVASGSQLGKQPPKAGGGFGFDYFTETFTCAFDQQH
jgi:hypothetical protein